MYLEKLEMQGFKSFANKNKLLFSGDVDTSGKHGLTAIVGPNGSGKSNIADAVRWVLGEQSLKNLRGKKSEDVIFSGSDKKTQLGMAEVSLYLNNKNRKEKSYQKNEKETNQKSLEDNKDVNGQSLSPLDYDEIVITRRLYRSGESEYLINGNRVRLADIQIMLAKANIGQKTYSVIGQGMVENFLNTGAAERKDFFDEATGVKQFQIKRDQALNKLENSYNNLQQVEMLLGEIQPRLKMLTRQVDKLKKRGQLEDDLHKFQLSYYSRIWKETDDKIKSAQGKISHIEIEKDKKEKDLNSLNSELAQIKEASPDHNEERVLIIKKTQEEKELITKDIARLNAELELQLESEGQFDAAWLNQHLENLKNEAKKLENELLSLKNDNLEEDEQILRSKIEKLQLEISTKNREREILTKKQEERNNLSNQINRLDAFLEASLESKGKHDLTWLNNKKEELKTSLNNFKIEIEKINLTKLETEIENLLQERAIVDKNINQKNQDLEEINQELKGSKEPAAGREEINRSIEEFLKNLDKIKQENDPVKIKDIINEAKAQFKKQISLLIDGEISNKLEVVKTLQASIIKLNENRQNINNEINQKKLELSTKQERKSLLTSRISELKNEVNEIEDKIKKIQEIPDADSIKTKQGLLNQQIKMLDEEISQLKIKSDTLGILEKKEVLVEKLNELSLAISARNNKIKLYQENLEINAKELLKTKEKIAKGENKKDLEKISLEKSNLEARLKKLDLDLFTWNEEIKLEERQRQKEKQKFFDIQEKVQKMQTAINILSQELNGFQIEIARQETRQEDLMKSLEEDQIDLEKLKIYEDKYYQEKDEEYLKQKITNYKKQLELIGGIDPEAEKEFIETNDRYQFLDKQTSDLNTTISSLEKVIIELDLNIKEKFEKEFKVIAEQFSKYFKILFNGGQAKIFKLEAEDEENKKETSEQIALEDERAKKLKKLKKYNALRVAGIEIQATPPGKKIQSISMLSGGERALTAIALICAIISANPSPFVVLDEVDAALDEANSERLAKILEDLSSKTQFISITHNRASMKKASIIYGVTMKSDGVSQLISIRLDQIGAFHD